MGNALCCSRPSGTSSSPSPPSTDPLLEVMPYLEKNGDGMQTVGILTCDQSFLEERLTPLVEEAEDGWGIVLHRLDWFLRSETVTWYGDSITVGRMAGHPMTQRIAHMCSQAVQHSPTSELASDMRYIMQGTPTPHMWLQICTLMQRWAGLIRLLSPCLEALFEMKLVEMRPWRMHFTTETRVADLCQARATCNKPLHALLEEFVWSVGAECYSEMRPEVARTLDGVCSRLLMKNKHV